MKSLPEKTIQRLSLYRRVLLEDLNKDFVFSHELASRAGITPAQVRRDLMGITMKGSPNRGYYSKDLVNEISKLLGSNEPTHVAVFGVGRLGQGLLDYFTNKKAFLRMVAAFDNDDEKCGRVICGTRCYHIKELAQVIRAEKIQIAVLACPKEEAQRLADNLVGLGIKGFVNFTPATIKVPDGFFVEDIDITASIEKVGYYGK